MSDPQTAVRILHLEDSPSDAASVADLLDAAGICREIVHVTHWELFEEALEQSRYDLILCASGLQGFDGLAALKLAREMRPEVPVIIVSGAIDPEEAVECLKAGAIDYLLKQRLERLPEAVQHALEQNRAPNLRQEVEERFRQLVDHSSEGFWLAAADPHAILYVSPAVERIAGVTAERFYQDASTWMLAIHPDDRAQVDKAWIACVQGQTPRFQAQYRIVRPDGSIRWILDSGTPIRNETGNVARVSGAFTDVTERTQAETRLSESEARFRQLAENVHDVFWLSDLARTQIFYISPAYETVWGRTCASLQASPRQWIDDIHPEDRQRVLRKALSKQTSGSYDEQFRIVRPDGTIRWIDARAFPVKDQCGAIYRIAGVARDITDSRMAAAALQDERDRLRQILDSQFGFVVELSLDGAIVEINQMPLTLAGLSREEVLGRPVVDIGWVQPNSVPLVLAGIKAAALGETMRCDVGAFFPDLGLRDVDAIFSPRRNAEGEVISVLGFGVDISERVHAETQVLKSLREKETLLKEIHHRVKNNLQVISSLLSMQADSVEDTTARSQLQESQHRVRAMAMIHEKLYQSDSLAKVDFGDYVSHLTIFLHRNYATRATVRLVVDADENVPLNIDTAIPAGLILNELVTNAFKHAFKDGQPHALTVLLRKSDDGCSLTVADDGPGLPAGFVLGKSESLGMELVEALTAQLKASLTVEKEGGTRFRLDFKELIYAARH